MLGSEIESQRRPIDLGKELRQRDRFATPGGRKHECDGARCGKTLRYAAAANQGVEAGFTQVVPSA